MYISTPPSPEVENFEIKIYYPGPSEPEADMLPSEPTIVIGNLSAGIVGKFKYLGVMVANINDIREEINRTLNTVLFTSQNFVVPSVFQKI